jgi:hypothetical protein
MEKKKPPLENSRICISVERNTEIKKGETRKKKRKNMN